MRIPSLPHPVAFFHANDGLLRRLRIPGVLFAASWLAVFPAMAQPTTPQPATAPPASAPKTTHAKKHSAAQAAATEAAPADTTPAPPPTPKWPAFDQPVQASVVWDSHGLFINAANSSLSQILKDVSTATGVDIQGVNTDQRVFGIYGPGPARDVLSQVLQGSGYNVIMVGDQGQGVPRQLLLSVRQGTTQQAAAARPNQPQIVTEEDDSPDDQSNLPEPPIHPGYQPGAPPRSPQQILQEMQQRQQQMQQQPGQPPN